MAINKVVYGDQTLVDLTQDTVEASNLLEGETAHDRSGAAVTGTAKQGHVIQDSSGTGVTQRNTMQFKGMTVTDDATNGKTVVEATKTSVGLGNVPNVTTDNQTPTVTEASTRANLAAGDTLKTIIGKIKKFFTDIKDLAFIAKDGSTSKYLRGDGTWQTFPTIPTVNNATLTIQKNGTTVQTFTANASSDVTCNITMSKSDVGLGNVDNTADANKSVNYANSAGYAGYAGYSTYVQLGDGIPLVYSESGDINFRFYQSDGVNVGYNSLRNIIDSINGKTTKSGDTMTGALQFASGIASLPAATPMAVSYGRVQCYGTISINADTDNSTKEYVIITAGKGVSNTPSDGLAVGYSNLQWQGKDVLTQTIVSRYSNGGNDPTACPIYIAGADANKRPAIGFYNPSASYSCILYMAADGSLYARWNDGTEKKIIGH